MKKILILIFLQLLALQFCNAQKNIDLKLLLGKPKAEVLTILTKQGIGIKSEAKNSSYYENRSYYEGFGGGLQIGIENDTVSTIWVEFTKRSTEAFPFQVDSILTPLVGLSALINYFGKPQESGGGMLIGNIKREGWVKWNLKSYQINCEILNDKVIMVTIMKADWKPGN